MRATARILSLAGMICISGMALAQTPDGAPPAPPAAGRGAPRAEWPPGYIDPGQPQPAYVSAATPQGTGPHPAVMATEPGAEEFVAYYPADLSVLGNKKLPLMVWANGSCTYLGNKFRHFLTDIASHDYFILAGGPMGVPDDGKSETISIAQNNPLQNPEAVRTPPAPRPGPSVTPTLLSKGIDWAIAENNRQGSKFYHRLDISKIAVMGQSCGGGVASTFGSDKRVKTVGLWSGAAVSNAGASLGSTMNKPVLIVTGDPRYDVAFYEGLSAFEKIRKPLVFYAWRVNMTHLGTYRQADGGELSPVATAWLDWQLKGDKEAARMFKGVDCGLCTNTHWHVQKRHID